MLKRNQCKVLLFIIYIDWNHKLGLINHNWNTKQKLLICFILIFYGIIVTYRKSFLNYYKILCYINSIKYKM